jgi:hypothetical protein
MIKDEKNYIPFKPSKRSIVSLRSKPCGGSSVQGSKVQGQDWLVPRFENSLYVETQSDDYALAHDGDGVRLFQMSTFRPLRFVHIVTGRLLPNVVCFYCEYLLA